MQGKDGASAELGTDVARPVKARAGKTVNPSLGSDLIIQVTSSHLLVGWAPGERTKAVIHGRATRPRPSDPPRGYFIHLTHDAGRVKRRSIKFPDLLSRAK